MNVWYFEQNDTYSKITHPISQDLSKVLMQSESICCIVANSGLLMQLDMGACRKNVGNLANKPQLNICLM